MDTIPHWYVVDRDGIDYGCNCYLSREAAVIVCNDFNKAGYAAFIQRYDVPVQQ